jgi:hypothetical protein
MYRTKTCGELRLSDKGKTVTLAGCRKKNAVDGQLADLLQEAVVLRLQLLHLLAAVGRTVECLLRRVATPSPLPSARL